MQCERGRESLQEMVQAVDGIANLQLHVFIKIWEFQFFFDNFFHSNSIKKMFHFI